MAHGSFTQTRPPAGSADLPVTCYRREAASYFLIVLIGDPKAPTQAYEISAATHRGYPEGYIGDVTWMYCEITTWARLMPITHAEFCLRILPACLTHLTDTLGVMIERWPPALTVSEGL